MSLGNKYISDRCGKFIWNICKICIWQRTDSQEVWISTTQKWNDKIMQYKLARFLQVLRK